MRKSNEPGAAIKETDLIIASENLWARALKEVCVLFLYFETFSTGTNVVLILLVKIRTSYFESPYDQPLIPK